jgi:hypothetical protein
LAEGLADSYPETQLADYEFGRVSQIPPPPVLVQLRSTGAPHVPWTRRGVKEWKLLRMCYTSEACGIRDSSRAAANARGNDKCGGWHTIALLVARQKPLHWRRESDTTDGGADTYGGRDNRLKLQRKKIIAIGAGAITIVAIVLSFAAGYLGLGWQWLRPAGELLLLAELVGLIVLERHQLFEPVSEKVGGIESRVEEIHSMVRRVTEQFGASGQCTLYPSAHELLGALAKVSSQALLRDQEAPQILRSARLLGHYTAVLVQNDPEFSRNLQSWIEAIRAYEVLPGSRADSRSRWWSSRSINAVCDLESFDFFSQFLRTSAERGVMNYEAKLLVRPRVESVISPALITDRDCVLVFDDRGAALRWGLHLQGRQYVTLFAQWFDDLWATIPDGYLVYSRNGLNQKALDRIKMELEAGEAARDGQG